MTNKQSVLASDIEFSSIENAIDKIANGQFVAVVDDPDRENEGDLVIAPQLMTLDQMTFLLQRTSGIVCVTLEPDRLEALKIPLMVQDNKESFRTAFTVSVDAAKGVTTGISVADRLHTAQLLANPNSKADDFVRPGHVFPLITQHGGVLKRAGHTEASIDLVRMAGLFPSGCISELVNQDYSMMGLSGIFELSREFDISLITIADLIAYRRRYERLIKKVSSAKLPTRFGDFIIHIYESLLDGQQHIALVKGNVFGQDNVLVRVHSECLTGDILGSIRCDCGDQLNNAMSYIAKHGQGVVIYLKGQEGRGVGLGHKIRAYDLQDKGYDTVDANLHMGFPIDQRDYGIGAQILSDLGLSTIRLITYNPHKYYSLKGFGLNIVERVKLPVKVSKQNQNYLYTKQTKLGHWLDLKIL